MTVKDWLKFIFSVTLPSVFSFLGKANITDALWIKWRICDWPIFKNTDILVVKDYLMLAGIIFTLFPLGTLYLISSNKYNKSNNQKLLLIRYIKDILIETIEEKLNAKNTKLNVRIFVPKSKFKYRFYKFLAYFGIKVAVMLYMKNVKGFVDDIYRDGLELTVYPVSQGIVGLCYNKREIVYGENLKSRINLYRYDDYQKQIMGDMDFCIAVPLFTKRNRIYGIMTIDSSEPLTMGPHKFEIFNLLETFRRRFQHDVLSMFEE